MTTKIPAVTQLNPNVLPIVHTGAPQIGGPMPGTPTFQFQGWLRQLWNMINGTLNKGYTGTVVISGETLTFQNGVLISKSP